MSDPEVIAAFDALRERLAVPERWTQRTFARIGGPKNGQSTSSADLRATCWCLEGALHSLNAGPSATKTVWSQLFRAIRARHSFKYPASWNDTPGRTHQQVLNLIDRAKSRYLAGVS